MPIIGSVADAGITRRRTPANVFRTEIIKKVDGAGPNCKLIEQDPNFELQSHYHEVDQFLIFVRGEGRIGRHPLSPYTVHFTGRQTPYGPIVVKARS